MSLIDMLVLGLLDSTMASYNPPMQSVVEDVEYEDVSEEESSKLITSNDETEKD